MFHDLNPASAVAVDLRVPAELAVAGSAAMDAQPNVVVDGAIAHEYAAAVQDQQREFAAIVDDSIVGVNVGFGGAGNFHSSRAVVADDVFCSRCHAVAAIQDQVRGECGNSDSSVIGHGNSAVHVEGAAAHADAGAGAALDGAVGEMHQRINAGEANAC